MDEILVFDIWGDYAHYKKIFATTSAVSYCLPTKTSIYGYIGAIIGLEKNENKYLSSFQPGECLIGIQIINPIKMARINTNLRSVMGRMAPNDNRKPTMIEYVYKPRYRIYIRHTNTDIIDLLSEQLKSHKSVYTPSMGLANLLSNFKWIGKYSSKTLQMTLADIHTVIPKSLFVDFDVEASFTYNNEILEVSQYSVEMDHERNVTKRDDILLDRTGKAIKSTVKMCNQINIDGNTINATLF